MLKQSNRSVAAQKRIGATPEERRAVMSIKAKDRWAKMSKEDRRKHALKMVKARKKNNE